VTRQAEEIIQKNDKKALNFVICIENESYRSYLKKALATQHHASVIFIDKKSIANAVAENSGIILILQSDKNEYELIEISTKLKRVFSNEIKIIFLSLDYRMSAEVSSVVDKFLQFPVNVDEILNSSNEIAFPLKKVLLIDDSKLVHKTIVGDLKAAGFDVYQAFDGKEGYELALEVKPSVIICDIEMPRMNGYETCEAIRKNKNLTDVHIIMSSTLGSATDQKKGFDVGVDEYITKPVNISELLDRVSTVFRSANAGRESILLLDHNNHLTKNMSKSLSQQGFSTRITDSIKTAIKSLKRLSCDLIIAEIKPTDGTIIDLFQELSAVDKNNRPDVLIMISEEGQSDARMVINAGAAGVLSKPFKMDSLLALVEKALADRRARKEKEQLGRYVSKASMRMAIEKAIIGSDNSQARADRKMASVFFSDIAGFTDRCERYSPKEIVEQINLLFEVMTKVIMKNQGDIDKFIGDACMAFWLDEGTKSSSQIILTSLLEMQQQIEIMNSEHPLLSKDPIVVRMGANTGEVILCDIGAADARVDLTIIGDTVNVAARLESASKQYGLNNLVSENTIGENHDAFCSRIIDKVQVKGKQESLKCYELINFKGSETKKQLELKKEFEIGYFAYQNGNFEAAHKSFEKSVTFEKTSKTDLNPSVLYMKRCQQLIKKPPKDWDGVWTLVEK
jgi:DNA-binding response OmpR family regulator